jgi:MFS family permease
MTSSIAGGDGAASRRHYIRVVTTPRHVQRVYLALTLFNTLAASLIWGINTLFLLDAGLSATEAFAANAFFTAGQVIFEVPTGVVADTAGRRRSYLIGAVTLSVSTALYLLAWRIHAPFWVWAATSMLLGLGFTFFSGATEAWLVDALAHAGYDGKLDAVFARGQIVEGAAMLVGAAAGGLIAQLTHLGAPYVVRAAALLVTFVVAFRYMRDWGFTPRRDKHPLREMKAVLAASIEHGLRRRAVRWMMLASPAAMGVAIYGFYATQPYFLELYGDQRAYLVAGLAASLVAGSQIAGGLLVPHLWRIFRRRTSMLLLGLALSAVMLALVGVVRSFGVVVVAVGVWGLLFAASIPVRQAYLNGLIPSAQRATVLSFDNLMGSGGGVIVQPLLGRVADASGFAMSFLVAAGVQALALPFTWLARRERAPSDEIAAERPAAR